jgi:hypothetical protein
MLNTSVGSKILSFEMFIVIHVLKDPAAIVAVPLACLKSRGNVAVPSIV